MSILTNVISILSNGNLFKDFATFAILGCVSLGSAIDLCRSRQIVDIFCKYIFSLLSIGFLGSATLMVSDLPIYLSSALSIDFIFLAVIVFSLSMSLHDFLHQYWVGTWKPKTVERAA